LFYLIDLPPSAILIHYSHLKFVFGDRACPDALFGDRAYPVALFGDCAYPAALFGDRAYPAALADHPPDARMTGGHGNV